MTQIEISFYLVKLKRAFNTVSELISSAGNQVEFSSTQRTKLTEDESESKAAKAAETKAKLNINTKYEIKLNLIRCGFKSSCRKG